MGRPWLPALGCGTTDHKPPRPQRGRTRIQSARGLRSCFQGCTKYDAPVLASASRKSYSYRPCIALHRESESARRLRRSQLPCPICVRPARVLSFALFNRETANTVIPLEIVGKLHQFSMQYLDQHYCIVCSQCHLTAPPDSRILGRYLIQCSL